VRQLVIKSVQHWPTCRGATVIILGPHTKLMDRLWITHEAHGHFCKLVL